MQHIDIKEFLNIKNRDRQAGQKKLTLDDLQLKDLMEFAGVADQQQKQRKFIPYSFDIEKLTFTRIDADNAKSNNCEVPKKIC